jgi:hypothetical protein
VSKTLRTIRCGNFAALWEKVPNPSHLHALPPNLTRMRRGKPERKFTSDQDSVEPQAGHARSDRCYREGQQRRSNEGRVRLRYRRCGVDPSSDHAKSSPAKHPSRHSSGAGLGHRERAVTELIRNVPARHEHTLAEVARFAVAQRAICG